MFNMRRSEGDLGEESVENEPPWCDASILGNRLLVADTPKGFQSGSNTTDNTIVIS